MAGYRHNPSETAEALRGGWLYTGDIGAIDADGYLAIHDRKKDLVIVSGYNVYPREVEEVLYRHPAIAEVAVIGELDPRKGERFRIKGIGSVICGGLRNIPDGEVFSCPVKDSVEGVIQYNAPTVYLGTSFDNIRLDIQEGQDRRGHEQQHGEAERDSR